MANFTTEMGNFTPLFDVVIRAAGVVGASVYGRVWRYCQGERGVCQASMDTIADELGMSRHTVLRWLKALCEVGYLEDCSPDLRNRPHTYRDTGKVQIQVRLDAVAESDTDSTAVAESNSGVAESNAHCSRESHEERKKREEKREELSADALFPPLGEQERAPVGPQAKAFKTTGDPFMDIIAGAALKQERGIPDWAMLGAEGLHPVFPVVKAFCELTGQDAMLLKKAQGQGWLKQFEKLGKDHGVSVKQLLQAHEVLPDKEWGEWHLQHHKWNTPFQDSYVDMLTYAARQIRDGTLETGSKVIRIRN